MPNKANYKVLHLRLRDVSLILASMLNMILKILVDPFRNIQFWGAV